MSKNYFRKLLISINTLLLFNPASGFSECGSYPLISNTKKFHEKTSEKKHGEFENSKGTEINSQSLYGWMKIDKTNNSMMEILQLGFKPSSPAQKLDPVYDGLMKLNWLKNNTFVLEVANSKNSTKKIYIENIPSDQWIFFSLNHNSRIGEGIFSAFHSGIDKGLGSNQNTLKFTTRYLYVLRHNFNFNFGSLDNKSKGFVGELGPIYYTPSYLKQGSNYWMGNYFNKVLQDNGYFLIEYIFDGKPNQIPEAPGWIRNERAIGQINPNLIKEQNSHNHHNPGHEGHPPSNPHSAPHSSSPHPPSTPHSPSEPHASPEAHSIPKSSSSAKEPSHAAPHSNPHSGGHHRRLEGFPPKGSSRRILFKGDVLGKLNGEILMPNGANITHSKKEIGIIMPRGSEILINGDLKPISTPLAETLCFYFSFIYLDPLGDKMLLYQRGGPLEASSMFIYLEEDGGKRYVSMDVIYNDVRRPGKLKKRTFINRDNPINPGIINKIQVCLSTSLANVSNAIIYVNGKTEVFDNGFGLNFNWDRFKSFNKLLSDKSRYKGKFLLNTFGVIEGAGGVIFSLEDDPRIKKTCFSDCKLVTSDITSSFNCQICEDKINNVNSVRLKKCMNFCGHNFKNYYNHCFECPEANCKGRTMPEMEIEKLDRHKQNFRIKPNIKLHRHYHDWSDRITVSVEGMKIDEDFKVMMFVVKNNTVMLTFEAFKHFREGKLIIEIANVEGIYDIFGNMMHPNQVSFMIDKYIVYSTESKSRMRSLGAFFAIGFFMIAFIGIFASCISSGKDFKVGSSIAPVIDLFERLQFLTFLLFVNVDLPPAQIDFISSIFHNTMEKAAFMKEHLIESQIEDYYFRTKYDVTTMKKFEAEELTHSFILNCTIPLACHIITFLVWLFYRIGFTLTSYHKKLKGKGMNRWFQKRVTNMETRVSVTMFLLFDVELTIFSALNIMFPPSSLYSTDTGILEFKSFFLSLSYFLAVVYNLMILASIAVVPLLTLGYPPKLPKLMDPYRIFEEDEDMDDDALEHSTVHQYRTQQAIVDFSTNQYNEVRRLAPPMTRAFRFMVSLRFYLYGIFLVWLYDWPMLQVSSLLVVNFFYTIVIYMNQPHTHYCEYVTDVFVEFLFLTALLCFWILAYDDKYVVLSLGSRVSIGWFIFLIFLTALMISFGVVIRDVVDLINKILLRRKSRIRARSSHRGMDTSRNKNNDKTSILVKRREPMNILSNLGTFKNATSNNLSTSKIHLQKSESVKDDQVAKQKELGEIFNIPLEEFKANPDMSFNTPLHEQTPKEQKEPMERIESKKIENKENQGINLNSNDNKKNQKKDLEYSNPSPEQSANSHVSKSIFSSMSDDSKKDKAKSIMDQMEKEEIKSNINDQIQRQKLFKKKLNLDKKLAKKQQELNQNKRKTERELQQLNISDGTMSRNFGMNRKDRDNHNNRAFGGLGMYSKEVNDDII